MRRVAWCLFAVAACGGKKEPPAAQGSGSARPIDAAVVDAAVAVDAAAAASCIPETPPSFGRVGADLVGCTGDGAQCWTIDAKTGAVAPRAGLGHLPGIGFAVDTDKLTKPGCYQDLCWKVPARDEGGDGSRIWVAYHPDGKRVAILDDPAGTIFDLATKKPLATFRADLGNSLGGLWFAGNLVMDAGYDAGPYAVLVYHDAKTGKKLGTFEDFYGGSASITSTGAVLVVGEDLTTVTLIDGASIKGTTTKRAIAKPPAGCEPQDPSLSSEDEDPKVKACFAFAKQHYFPYSSAILIDDPAGYVGLSGGEVFTLDKKLVETARVKLAVCPKKPDE